MQRRVRGCNPEQLQSRPCKSPETRMNACSTGQMPIEFSLDFQLNAS